MAPSNHGTLISPRLFSDNQLWPVLLFYELNSKFQLWCHSKLIISFIYTSTQLSHSTKLWYHRALLIVCAYFEEFVIAYFKKSISCFKPINSWLEKNGLSYRKEKFAWMKYIFTYHTKIPVVVISRKTFLVSKKNVLRKILG